MILRVDSMKSRAMYGLRLRRLGETADGRYAPGSLAARAKVGGGGAQEEANASIASQ